MSQILRLIAVTKNHKRTENNYVWHIGVMYGNREYVCQYTKDRINQNSANLRCINRADSKTGQKCEARVTVMFRDEILPFIKIIKQNKSGPVYGFDGGIDTITDVQNYYAELHQHTKRCLASSDDSFHCKMTKHSINCYSTSRQQYEKSGYSPILRNMSEITKASHKRHFRWYKSDSNNT